VLGLLYPRRLQKTYHAAGGGCRNRACQVRSWSSEEAGLDLAGDRGQAGGRLDRLHMRVHLRWAPWWTRRLLVVTGAQCPLTKPAVAAVEQQAATGPHVAAGAGRAARRYLRVRGTARADPPEAWGQACAEAASAPCASCRSDYNLEGAKVTPCTRDSETLSRH
jgi:hypothetical protein